MVHYEAGRSEGLSVSVKLVPQIRPELVLAGLGVILLILYLKSRVR